MARTNKTWNKQCKQRDNIQKNKISEVTHRMQFVIEEKDRKNGCI